jgi:hypothetical protein
MFYVYCSLLFTGDKSQFIIFAEQKHMTYFVVKNYTLIEYNIIYVMIFFQKKIEVSEFEFLEL